MTKRIGKVRDERVRPKTVRKPVTVRLLGAPIDSVANMVKAYRAESKLDGIKPLAKTDAMQEIFDQLVNHAFATNAKITLISPDGEAWDVDLGDFVDPADFNLQTDDIEDADAGDETPRGTGGSQLSEQKTETEGKETDAQDNDQRELTEEEELAELQRRIDEESKN